MPKGTVLGPLCYIIHKYDFPSHPGMFKFVEDVTTYEAVKRESNCSLPIYTAAVSQWSNLNRVVLSSKKTKEIVSSLSSSSQHSQHLSDMPPAEINGTNIQRVTMCKLLYGSKHRF